jgi:serine protease
LSYINGAWQYNDYTYAEGSMAVLKSPTQGSTFTGTSVTFTWTPGANVTEYDLYLGTTGVGSNNLFQSGHITSMFTTVTNMPTNGATIYARLLSEINGTWKYVDYTFTESSLAELKTPAPGSLLTGSGVTFTWTTGAGVTQYDLYLGTTGVGSSNLYSSGHIVATTATVNNLPTTGATIYARLLSYINGAWEYADYTYTEATLTGTPAVLTSPAPNSVLTGSTVAFAWTAGTNATEYDLYLGTTGVGSNNLYTSGHTTATSATVTTLTTNGATIYARLLSYINGAWEFNDYTYTAQQ